MKKYLIGFILSLQIVVVYGQVETDKSLSPYFLVKGDAESVAAFPLAKTLAEVNIAGIIADVTVRQYYQNTGRTPIEALYVFPASTQAAVYSMEMKIGERLIIAEIAEKQEARQRYDQAKKEGKRASLLEQHRPNVFQMNVANIMPGDQVEVTLRYTELLIPEQGIYEFVYPTVVGPRYTNGQEQHNEGYTAIPYTSSGEAPGYEFDIEVYLNGGMPIHDIQSSSHRISIYNENSHAANVVLGPSESNGGNRDFILQYSYKGNKIETGMLVYDDGDEKFFLCMAQPPKQVKTALIPPREYIFLVDVSGSMRGFPLDVTKDLLKNLISELRPSDRFNIMFFSGGSRLWQPGSLRATSENLNKAIAYLNNLQSGGGTEILSALKKVMELPRQSEALSRSILVITDGYVSVESEAFDLVSNHLNEANLFAFGIGSGVNRHLIEGLARAGQGVPFIVTKNEEAYAQAKRFKEYIKSPIMTQIEASYDRFKAYDVAPASIPDVLSERPVVLFGKYKGKTKGSIHLDGTIMEEMHEGERWQHADPREVASEAKQLRLSFPLEDANTDKRNAALKYLWARERIRNLSDFNGYRITEEKKAEVTRLGLKYNLLTAYTSFIAVEKQVVNHTDDLDQVKQPLPLPQGVENTAVGFHLSIQGISNMAGLDQAFYNQYWFWTILLVVALLVIWLLVRRKFTLKSPITNPQSPITNPQSPITNPQSLITNPQSLITNPQSLIPNHQSPITNPQSPDLTKKPSRDITPHNFFFLLPIIIATAIGCNKEVVESIAPTNMETAVTFILGEDRGDENLYFQNAQGYFATDSVEGTPLIVTTCSSMLDVRNWLAQNGPLDTPWRQINLVVHGNQWTGINVPITPEGDRCNAEGLGKMVENGTFMPLPNSVVDEGTHIAVFGCDVGKDNELLTQLALAFGGNDKQCPLVSSARYFNIFEKNGDTYTRHLAENYFTTYPPGKFPGNHALVHEFDAKYPEANINWMEALLTLEPQEDKSPYVYYFYIPVNWMVAYKSHDDFPVLDGEEAILEWIKKQPELMKELNNMQLPSEQFLWTVEEDVYEGQAVLAAKGLSIIYCILNPVVDGQQKYVRTSTTDAAYYAMSR